MDDLKLAQDELHKGRDDVVVVRGGEVKGRAQGNGLLPLLKVLDRLGDDARDVSVADRVVGKAAALFLVEAGVSAVYGQIMSQLGFRFLQTGGVRAEAGQWVPFIMNRREDGLCPLERISVETKTPEAAREKIREFLSGRT